LNRCLPTKGADAERTVHALPAFDFNLEIGQKHNAEDQWGYDIAPLDPLITTRA
jgi:hypothetical protein